MRWNAICANCHKNFTSINDYSTHECEWKNANKDAAGYQHYKEEKKMTREEALAKLPLERWYGEDGKRGYLLDSLEKLGLLKFDEPKKEVKHCISFQTVQFGNDIGIVKLEMWPEGLVLWVGGEIKWKSWVDYYKKGDAATIDYYDGLRHEKQKQAGIIS